MQASLLASPSTSLSGPQLGTSSERPILSNIRVSLPYLPQLFVKCLERLLFFEGIVQQFYTHIFTAPKESYSKPTKLGITFTSGYLAGIICAVVSHPADTIVSLMGRVNNKGKSIGTIAEGTGFLTLATKGLGARMIMIGTLTGKCCSAFLLKG